MNPLETITYGLRIVQEDVPVNNDVIRLLLAIGHQESGFKTRVQQPVAWARGHYQFEKNGGVKGVMTHHATKLTAYYTCKHFGIKTDMQNVNVDEVYSLLMYPQFDLLAVIFARLLLFTDPHPIPCDKDEAWGCYLRTWRPGKPHRNRWDGSWEYAKKMMDEN